MQHFNFFRSLLYLQVFLFLVSCSKDDQDLQDAVTYQNFTVNQSGDYVEDFENASKTSYAAGTVNLADGDWYFDDALVGSLSGDAKNGSKSVRIQNSGSVTMNFDLTEGATSFSVSYAKYNRDRQTSFQVYYSTDSGASWNQLGRQVSVKKSNLSTAIFTLNVSGNVRFEIRKTDGSGERLNIDDLTVVPNAAGTGGGGSSGSLIDLTEDYESGSKGSYAGGTVDLPSGTWYLEEALLGSLDNDRKTGTKSVRIRDYGMLQMNFDVDGAESVSFNHAVYGTDGSSSWQLEASTNQGASWSAISVVQNSTSTTLENVSFPAVYSGTVRFRIVKLSGSGDRINIDDLTIHGTTDPGGSSGGGTGGGTGGGISGVVHLTMGNPSAAVTDVNYPNNYLLEKEEYVMSYSRDRGQANWVSWHLDEAWLGDAPRQNDFRNDTSLPAGWYQVQETDYSGSGFDRGHQCPSADRTLSVDDNSNTFFMTNMMPQAPNNNRYAWANLESYCRSMLSGGYEIYIISGGYGIGGDGSNGYAEYVANGMVEVPSNTWKVIMIIPDGDNDVSRVTASTRVIAVDMPNSQSVTSDWTQYKTTVDDIELMTGFDFFSEVPDAIEDALESQVDAV
ncbi:MAG: DNA/RNA non-specific endonuclease [Christiangramia sp.]|uniref:DNA/RNA non-specific endonuclease n=1 Tax=Christiangramia sp. TaxID=1931228 RepID=UPI0032428DE5